jgi:hypothetical protein
MRNRLHQQNKSIIKTTNVMELSLCGGVLLLQMTGC